MFAGMQQMITKTFGSQAGEILEMSFKMSFKRAIEELTEEGVPVPAWLQPPT